MQSAVATGDWSGAAFVQAGTELKKLIDLQPFQKGFLAAPWTVADGQAATMGNGKAAMELMGQWAPGAMQANSPDERGHRRQARLVPLPGLAVAPACRPTRSAAATASRSARTPRRRPSTS